MQVHASVKKAKAILGFIEWWPFEFQDPCISKSLLTALVSPIFESSIAAWSPNYKCYVGQIGVVQKAFLKFALHGLGWNTAVTFPPYENRLKLLHLPTLESRRTWLSVSLVIRLLSGECYASFLLNQLNMHISARVARNY